MMLSLLDLEALLVIVVDDAIYSLLIDIFAAFSSKELHDLFEWYISAWFESEALLNCSVSKHPG